VVATPDVDHRNRVMPNVPVRTAMLTCIQYLNPGTKLRLACDRSVTGTLVGCTGCSASVKLHAGACDVIIEETNGETRRFRATPSRTTTWALATLVEPIFTPEPVMGSNPEEIDMSTKTATKKTGTKKPAKASAKKRPAKDKANANGKLSALDAAAKVLGEAKEPMNTKQMIEAMAQKGYWTSPGGKTPHATLYSAILREIDTKGTDARFKKTERGMFALKA
jgi:HB1, ASXL, restriction endonuclease HTH domain